MFTSSHVELSSRVARMAKEYCDNSGRTRPDMLKCEQPDFLDSELTGRRE